MVHILYPDQIQDLKSEKVWPQRFYSESEEKTESGKSFKEYRNTKPIDSEGSDSDDSLEANVNQINRPVVYMSSDSESSDDWTFVGNFDSNSCLLVQGSKQFHVNLLANI